MLSLDEVKDFLRIDYTEDDILLSSFLLASENYILNATHSNADKGHELFKLAQRFLVAHWFENRNTVIVGSTTTSLDFALESLLLQISYTSSDAV